jgi:hypothetical protein
MRPPDEINHYRYDDDGLLMDPLAPVAWDPAWDGYGEQPLPGLDVFGPITREDLTPHDGERGVDLALHELLRSERRRRGGWSMLWLSQGTRTGRCAGLKVRAFDDEGGRRTLATLEASFDRLGFMVKRRRARPVDPDFYPRKERIA